METFVGILIFGIIVFALVNTVYTKLYTKSSIPKPRCGDFGGRTKKGKPCRVKYWGLCKLHKDQALRFKLIALIGELPFLRFLVPKKYR